MDGDKKKNDGGDKPPKVPKSKDDAAIPTSPRSADTSRSSAPSQSNLTTLSVPEARRTRRVSGTGDGRQRKTSTIAIPVQPSQESSMSMSRRSFSRGAMFGNIPDYIGSPIVRRASDVMSTTSSQDGGDDDMDRDDSYDDSYDQGDPLTRQSSVNMSRYSVSIHPITGETLFMGFTKKQWFLLMVFSIADLFAGIVYSLQAPFYPQEAEKKGATPTEYGLVFGVFELTMFAVSPIYGKYVSDHNHKISVADRLLATFN